MSSVEHGSRMHFDPPGDGGTFAVPVNWLTDTKRGRAHSVGRQGQCPVRGKHMSGGNMSSDTSRELHDGAVQLPSNEQPEEVLLDYEYLAEVWAQRGWLTRAIALCKVILRLELAHEPTRRLLTE